MGNNGVIKQSQRAIKKNEESSAKEIMEITIARLNIEFINESIDNLDYKIEDWLTMDILENELENNGYILDTTGISNLNQAFIKDNPIISIYKSENSSNKYSYKILMENNSISFIKYLNWNDISIEFIDNSNGLYAFNGNDITPKYRVIYNGDVLEENRDIEVKEGSDLSANNVGKHEIVLIDKNDKDNEFYVNYYIYDINLTAVKDSESDGTISFTATRNVDDENISEFGILIDRKKLYKDNLSIEKNTNILSTTDNNQITFTKNVMDLGCGVYGKTYMKTSLNGKENIIYGKTVFLTAWTPEQVSAMEIQTVEPDIINGKVHVTATKPPYDVEKYYCKEMGMIFSKNGSIASLEDAENDDILIYENVGNGFVSKGCINAERLGENDSMDRYSTYTANISFSGNNPVYVRTYVIFTNIDNNQDIIRYGDYSVKYNN